MRESKKDKKEVIIKAKKYAELVSNYLQFTNVFLFGSYVNSAPRKDSDIDIAFFVDKISDNEDYYSLIVQLHKLTRQVDSRIEPHIFELKSKSGFGEYIRKNGEEIAFA